VKRSGAEIAESATRPDLATSILGAVEIGPKRVEKTVDTSIDSLEGLPKRKLRLAPGIENRSASAPPWIKVSEKEDVMPAPVEERPETSDVESLEHEHRIGGIDHLLRNQARSMD
jgi:hypothetical protein